MRHIDECNPEFALQLRQDRLHADDKIGVQCRKRLIQKQNSWLDDQRARQRDPLFLASGKTGDVTLGKFRNLHAVQPFKRPSPALGSPDAAHLQSEFDILTRCQERKQCQRLPYQRRVTFMGRDIIHHPAIHQDIAFRRRFKPGQHPQRRRLAATGRSHDGDKFAGIDGEIHIFNGHEIVKAFDHRPEFDKGSHHDINFPSCGVSSTPPGR